MLTPYYQDEYSTIYHADCRDVLPCLNKVDLVLTDPPYGIGEKYASYGDTTQALEALIAECFPLMRSLADRVAITPGVANIARWPRSDWVLCWVTPAGSGSGPWGFTCWQPVLVYGPDPYLAAGKGRRPDLITLTETAERNGHPCPKPLNVWKRVMQRCTLGYAILDPFMGSGTTLRAAKDLGLKSVGIEIEEKYCEIAVKRLRQEVLAFT